MSPDPGGVKRAQLLREALQETTGKDVGFAILEKRRSAGIVTGDQFAGEVAGRAVHIVDDMICGGGTMLRAAAAARSPGAVEVHAIASHGLFTAEVVTRLAADGACDTLTVTDSTLPFSVPTEPLSARLRVLASARLFAAAIRETHGGPHLSGAPHPELVSVDSGH